MLKTPRGTVPSGSSTHRGKLPFNSSHMRSYTLAMMYAKYDRTCRYFGTLCYSVLPDNSSKKRAGYSNNIFNSHVFRVLFLVGPQIINDARKKYRSEDIPNQIGKGLSFVQSRSRNDPISTGFRGKDSTGSWHSFVFYFSKGFL